jgi:hypothetical protein
MVALHGFFDESGKGHEHPVVVFSGFVATASAWERLCEDWEVLLRRYKIARLHFTEHKRETEMINQFIKVITRNVETGVSVAVDVNAFKKLPESLRGQIGNDPYYIAFKCVVLDLINRVCSVPGASLSFTCDEDENTTSICLDWYRKLKKEESDAHSRLASFCVASDAHYPQLQAADLFAGVNRPEATHRLLRYENRYMGFFRALRLGDLNFRTLILTNSILRDFAADWKAAVTKHAREETSEPGEI